MDAHDVSDASLAERRHCRQYMLARGVCAQRSARTRTFLWALLAVVLQACPTTCGFLVQQSIPKHIKAAGRLHLKPLLLQDDEKRNFSRETTRQYAVFPSVIQNAIPSLSNKLFLWIGGAPFLVLAIKKFGRQLLWPNSGKDSKNYNQYPLPPGSLGCPFLGFNLFEGSKKKGPEVFYSRASARLGHPRIWKFYFLGTPVVSVSGAEHVKQLQNLEFHLQGTEKKQDTKVKERQGSNNGLTINGLFGQEKQKMFGDEKQKKSKKKKKVFTTNNLLFEPNEEKHKFLRRLVGQAMTPAAVAKAIPVLQTIANGQVDKMLSSSSTTLKMQDESVDYTLEVTKRQLLGLDLVEKEKKEFLQALKTWLKALFFPTFRIPFTGPSPALKARLYLESVIENRIDELERNGPDGSTLSSMVFATDNDNEESNKKLTREQVVENSLLLISAGSETTASTITFCTFLLGLHSEVWNKVVEEQRNLQSIHGDQLTKALLDDKCPYLNGVVNEALRLGAVSGGFPRKARETFVLDKKQIPKGWYMFGNIRLTHELDPISRTKDGSHMDVKQGFSPERWLSDETRPVDFIPFGVGPRYCLGATLALAEIKVFFAVMARRMDFDLLGRTDEIEWNTRTIIPRPADEVPIATRAR